MWVILLYNVNNAGCVKGIVIMPVNTGANTNINIRVDSEVKNKAQELFLNLGLDMTSAINIF
jgi:hypothetical protein